MVEVRVGRLGAVIPSLRFRGFGFVGPYLEPREVSYFLFVLVYLLSSLWIAVTQM
jgi:hypothetical protein